MLPTISSWKGLALSPYGNPQGRRPAVQYALPEPLHELQPNGVRVSPGGWHCRGCGWSRMWEREEWERGGPYTRAGDLVRRTGLKPQAVLSLPSSAAAPNLEDFSKFERMIGEYRVMGIYPRGHVMQFVRLSLPPAYCPRRRRQSHLLANWCAWPAGPLPGSTPRDGTVPCLSPSRTRRATCSSSSGPRSSPAARRAPGNRVILAWGTASLRDGTANVIVSDV